MFLLIIIFSLISREVLSIRAQHVTFNVNNKNYFDGSILGKNDVFSACISNKKKCIRKCCQQNEVFTEAKCEKSDNQDEMKGFLKKSGFVIENMYTIVYSELNCNAKKNLYKICLEDFILYQNGSVFVQEANCTFTLENYCLETDSRSDGTIVVVFICGPSDGTLDLTLKAATINIGKCFNSIKECENFNLYFILRFM